MKPVHQTRFGTDGNCVEACLATILELPLNEVPDCEGDVVSRTAVDFCRQHGFLPVVVGTKNDWFLCGGHHPYGIAVVESKRPDDYTHAVVFEKQGDGWSAVWDPDHHAPRDASYNVLMFCVLLIR